MGTSDGPALTHPTAQWVATATEAAVRGSDVVVTGWVGSGRSSVIRGVRAGLAARGYVPLQMCPAAPPNLGGDERPLSYLSGLLATVETLGGPGPAPTEAQAIVEPLATALQRAAGDRRIALLCDDLHRADDTSLAVLPLLRRRAGAHVVASLRIAPGRRPRPAVVDAVRRLATVERLHLTPLSGDDALAVLRRTGHLPAEAPSDIGDALLRRSDAALGTARRSPGLLGAVQHDGTLRRGHPLLAEVLARGEADAAAIAFARTLGGLVLRDIARLSRSVGRPTGELVVKVDALHDAGWLQHRDGRWDCTVPALGGALRHHLRETERRLLLVLLVARGLSNTGISSRMGLSEKRVEALVSQLLTEHRCTNRTELVTRFTQA